MFFSRKRRGNIQAHTRYGRGPLLTNNRSSGVRNRRSMTIPNVSMPSLTTIKRILLGLTACVIIGAGLYVFVFSSYFKIGNIYIQYEELQNENNSILEYFSSLKGKNILTTDTDTIVNQIHKDHPELQQITAKKILPGTIQIHFSEFPIVANIEQVVDGKTLGKMMVNAVGMPVYGNTENPNLPYIKIISKTPKVETLATMKNPETNAATPEATTSTATPTDSGTSTESPVAPATTVTPSENPTSNTPVLDPTKPILTAETLNYILKATSYFEEKFGMKIMETQFLINARELHIKTEKYFTIWLDTQISYERQFLKLKKAMATVDIYKVPLNYIDLRITGTSGEKVIFKRKK